MGVGGAVLAVNLTDQAMTKSPQALAQLLLETINAGMQEIASITNEVVSPFVSSAHLNLQAITSGQLPKIAEAPARNGYAREIEEASAIPKRRLGAYGKAFGTAAGNTPQTTRYTSEEEDGNG